MRNVRIIWKYQGDPPFKDHNLDPFVIVYQLGPMLKIVKNQDYDSDILKVMSELSHSKNPMSTLFAIEIT
jgi:hypothetical protein